MDAMLEGIENTRAIMDDVIIGVENEEHHDKILKQVVQRMTNWNLSVNFDKCQIKKAKVNYAGHTVTADGLEPRNGKFVRCKKCQTPQSKGDVRRFLGLVQYLAKFLPDMSDVDAPLREVVKKNNEFFWEKPQEESFNKLKKLCSSAPVLARYDATKDVTIQCDASSYALGGVLLQEGRPVAYTSRALTPTEKRLRTDRKRDISDRALMQEIPLLHLWEARGSGKRLSAAAVNLC